ncbi:MAG: hypothetical protein WD294_11150 [Phycisphaeraceae bacterium]
MPDIDEDKLLLIVVGAHLKAEAADRPIAYRLQQTLNEYLDVHAEPSDLIVPLVCSDVWYLNNEELHNRPLICIGGPGVNALSAYLYPRLPNALQVDEQLVIQLDPEMLDLRVNIWGMAHGQTASAVELFNRKYLDAYLQRVLDEQEDGERGEDI